VGLGLFGIIIISVGVFIVILGLLLLFGRRRSGPGRLPGDIKVRRGNVGCYFPIVTSILISLALTIILNLILWLVRC
jgi:hypothetical protein